MNNEKGLPIYRRTELGHQQANGLPAGGDVGTFEQDLSWDRSELRVLGPKSHKKSPGKENGNSEPATPPSFSRQLMLGVQVGICVGTIAYYGIRLFRTWARRRGRPHFYGDVVPVNAGGGNVLGEPALQHLPLPGEVRNDDLVLPGQLDEPLEAIPVGTGVRRRVRVVELKEVEEMGYYPVVQDNPLDNNSDTGQYQVYNFDTKRYRVPDLTSLGLQPTFRAMFDGAGETYLTWHRIVLNRGDVTVELPVDTVNRLKIFWLKVGLCEENARLIFSVAAEAVRKLALDAEQAAYVIVYSSIVATLAAAEPTATGGVSAARLAALGRFLGNNSVNTSIYESGRALDIPFVHWSLSILLGVTAALSFTAVTYTIARKEHAKQVLLKEIRALRLRVDPQWL